MLKDYAILKFTGEDAVSFLHGQFTSDIQTQANNTTSLTSWCNAKGQVIVTGIIYKTEAELLFIIHQSLQEFVEKRLRMFVLRSDVTIENVSGATITLPDINELSLTIFAQKQTSEIDNNEFLLQSIKAGIPWLTKTHQEEYQPQMLNMDLLQGLSYQKGCYPGQEVIARLHYRGTIKKRLFIVESNSALNIGDSIVASEERLGDVINVAKDDNNHIALAVCNTDIKNAEDITCNGNTVTVPDVPYS